MKSTHLHRLRTIAAGQRVGDVERAFLDPKQRRIIGFAISTAGGFWRPEAGLIADVDEVEAIGPDALMLTTATPAGALTNQLYAELIDLDSLHGREVYTDDGRRLGQVDWSDFDDRHYTLSSLAVRAIPRHHDIPADTIISIGSELIVVRGEVVAAS